MWSYQSSLRLVASYGHFHSTKRTFHFRDCFEVFPPPPPSFFLEPRVMYVLATYSDSDLYSRKYRSSTYHLLSSDRVSLSCPGYSLTCSPPVLACIPLLPYSSDLSLRVSTLVLYSFALFSHFIWKFWPAFLSSHSNPFKFGIIAFKASCYCSSDRSISFWNLLLLSLFFLTRDSGGQAYLLQASGEGSLVADDVLFWWRDRWGQTLRKTSWLACVSSPWCSRSWVQNFLQSFCQTVKHVAEQYTDIKSDLFPILSQVCNSFLKVGA